MENVLLIGTRNDRRSMEFFVTVQFTGNGGRLFLGRSIVEFPDQTDHQLGVPGEHIVGIC